MDTKEKKLIWDRTVERRTVLQWLGSGTVLALGGRLLAACTSADQSTG